MEIGLREMLILMAMIVIAVLALDIFKRTRQNRNALKFKLEPIAEPIDDPLATEIGSVRKAHRDPAQHARFDDIEQAYEDLERPQLHQLKQSTQSQSPQSVQNQEAAPIVSMSPATPASSVTPATETTKPRSSSVSTPRIASEATLAAAQQRTTNKNSARNRTYGVNHTSNANNKVESTPAALDASDVIILNIMARPQHHFAGDAIVKAALMCGLRYGENQIFHFYEPSLATKKEKAIFSLVNIVKPGVFDLNNMQDFSSPGLCLFMSLPGPDNIETSFQKMLLVAHKLANQLDTDLYDDLHNPLTQKRLKQMHERVLQLHNAQQSAQNSQASLHEVQADNPARAKTATA